MSSEMRELIAKWRSEVDGGPDRELKEIGYDACLLDCADELEALLARTEAGADGRIDHHKAMQALEDLDDCARMDVGIAATGPYDLLRRYIMQQNRTHPQDASGDAERFAAVMNCQWLRSSKYGDQVFGWREEFLSRVNAEVAAMQAKEAK